MVYDPNNPMTPPEGGYAITSVPPGGGGVPQMPTIPRPPGLSTPPGQPSTRPPMPGGGRMPTMPGFPSGPISPPGGGMPPMPGGGGMPTQIAPVITGGRANNPAAGLLPEGGFGGMGNFNRDAMRSFLDQFKASLFSWLQSRPQNGGDMQAWLGQRPEFDVSALRTAMFSPPAPAPAAPPAPPVPPAI